MAELNGTAGLASGSAICEGFWHVEKTRCSAAERPAYPLGDVRLGNGASCDRTDGLHGRRRRYRGRREEEYRRGRGAARFQGLCLSGKSGRAPGGGSGPRRSLSRLGALHLLSERLRTEVTLLCTPLDLKQKRQINCATGRTYRLHRRGAR